MPTTDDHEEAVPLASGPEAAAGENIYDSSSSRSSSPDLQLDYHLQPLSSSEHQQPTPSKGKLTRLNGLALVISLQIGSGIFAAPAQVSQFSPSPFSALLVWFL